MASAILRGFALGFAIALTPGPMFFLCLRRTLSSGWRSGLPTGLGIATADGVYAAIAALGIGGLAVLLRTSERWLTVAGGVALVLLGMRSLLQNASPRGTWGRSGGGPAARAYSSAVALTLANPATVVSFAALFAAVGVSTPLVVPAVILGSLAWWLLLVAAAAALRSGVDRRAADVLARLSGLALVVFGVVAVGSGALR